MCKLQLPRDAALVTILNGSRVIMPETDEPLEGSDEFGLHRGCLGRGRFAQATAAQQLAARRLTSHSQRRYPARRRRAWPQPLSVASPVRRYDTLSGFDWSIIIN